MATSQDADTEPFERVEYGDDCPVCGDPVKAVVTSYAEADGPRVQNSECSEYKRDSSQCRFIFHQ